MEFLLTSRYKRKNPIPTNIQRQPEDMQDYPEDTTATTKKKERMNAGRQQSC